MIPLLASAATAASPGGWWVDDAAPADRVDARVVWVPASEGAPAIYEATLRAAVGVGGARLSASMPAVAATSVGWSDVGAGLLQVGVGWDIGRAGRPLVVGVDLRGPATPRSAWVSSWGSHAAATVPALGASVVACSTQNPSAPWTWTVAAGLVRSPYLFDGEVAVFASAGLAQVVPVAGPLGLVLEAEVVRDPTPAHARALARIDLGAPTRLALDVGAQVPLRAGPFAAHPIAQLRAYTGRDE